MLTPAKHMSEANNDSKSFLEAPATRNEEESSGPSELAATRDLPKVKEPKGIDSPTFSDLDRVLVEAAKEMSFDWPESLPVEQIIPALTGFALGSLLLAGLVALGAVLLSFAA